MSTLDELRIRNVDTNVVLKLTSMAKQRGMSRSEYVKGILSNHVYSLKVKEVDAKYQELAKLVIDALEGNALLLGEILDVIRKEKG